ncbi:hypothetical protein [Streptomyces xanthophaeus]|uniref:hypothetical protein n=1 Tax=Streptomyces xanthophaeus TaxID=67385 RepID=UPI002647CA6C|nr:hypothetical protein [Streptomyces xanthophaeus]WKD36565.1 hypothetical protein KO717_34615 [Streptomyces xanthophaeus]
MTFSSGIVAYGIVEHSMEASVGGGLAGLAASAMLTLAKVRAWTVDTTEERRQLEEAKRQAHDTHTRYVAAEGALEGEHRRRVRDLEGERAALLRQVEAAKADLDDRYEAQREALIIESMQTGIKLYLAGLLNAPATAPEAKIMPFPGQQQQAARARATGHPADQAPEAARDREVGRP